MGMGFVLDEAETTRTTVAPGILATETLHPDFDATPPQKLSRFR